MKAVVQKKEDKRLELRISAEDKQLFEHASSIRGYKSVSAFIRSIILEEAKSIIEKERNILQSERDKEIFFNALMQKEAKPNKALAAAFKFHTDMLSK